MRRPPIIGHRRKRILLNADPITDFDVDAGTSTVELSPASVEQAEVITVTITARNAAGQALNNKAITSVTLDPAGSGTVGGAGNTNISGVAVRTITAGDVGNGNTVTVVCDSVSITQVPTFDVTASGLDFWAEGFWATGFWATGFWAEAA